ncbi:MAG TPA: hypothetical protein VGB62_00455 [Allosphingosinicella sp.]
MRFRNDAVRLLAMLGALWLSLSAAPAFAAVQITFYSKELGASFPHTFVTVEGAPDRGGPRIDEDYGFSAKTISPAILMGRVKGEVISDHSPSYVRGSDKHFTMTLSDSEYDRVLATIEHWRKRSQPTYDLDRQNCIHFVADIARSIGLTADVPKQLVRKPRSYVEWLTASNVKLLQDRSATLYRAKSGAAKRGRAEQR